MPNKPRLLIRHGGTQAPRLPAVAVLTGGMTSHGAECGCRYCTPATAPAPRARSFPRILVGDEALEIASRYMDDPNGTNVADLAALCQWVQMLDVKPHDELAMTRTALVGESQRRTAAELRAKDEAARADALQERLTLLEALAETVVGGAP